jgi:uncharacterized damage-inducible protein DinB
MIAIAKPAAGEFPPYARMYIDRLPADGRVLDHMRAGLDAAMEMVRPLSEAQLAHRYAPGKWTVREVLVHVVDDERIYAYRALRFARGDTTPLPGFEQDAFARHSGANEREIGDIMEEYRAVRAATLALFRGLPEEAVARGGVADGNFVTVRALAFHIAGHESHHLEVIRERYLRG